MIIGLVFLKDYFWIEIWDWINKSKFGCGHVKK